MEKQNILITFDIDGTIMLAGNGGMDHRNAMRYAINTLFGIDKDPRHFLQREFDGCSDKWIAAECIKKAMGTEEASEEMIDKFYKLSGEYFVKNHKGNSLIYPGIEAALKKLNEIPGTHVGLVSGNIPEIGWKKLSTANLDKYFDKNLGGLGTHMNRAEIIQGVVDTATKLYGKLDRVIHVGDAMQDVAAALDAGVIAVAVDTGRQQNKVFRQPAFVFENLEVCLDDFISVVLTGKTLSGADHVDQKFHE